MGVDIVTTVLAEAVSYDLVDLATVKEELSIPDSDTSNDNWLARQISAVSRNIQGYCNRVFVVETLQDLFELLQDPYPYQVPGGAAALQLSRWPLALYAGLATTADAPAGTSSLSLPDTSGLIDNMPAAGNAIPAGTIIVSGSITPSTAESPQVPNQVTLSQPLSADLPAGGEVAFGISVVQTLASGVTQQLVLGTDFIVDPKTGQLVRLNPFTGVKTSWEALPTTVTYSAGYQEIPEDLVDAALTWVTWRFNERGRDPTLRTQTQPGLGEQSFWVGGPPMSGSVPSSIAGTLDRYRVPVVA